MHLTQLHICGIEHKKFMNKKHVKIESSSKSILVVRTAKHIRQFYHQYYKNFKKALKLPLCSQIKEERKPFDKFFFF